VRYGGNCDNINLCLAEECPAGTAWSDKAFATNLAHRSAVCSNRGICQHTTGECLCYPGYTGNACQRSGLTHAYYACLFLLMVMSCQVHVRVSAPDTVSVSPSKICPSLMASATRIHSGTKNQPHSVNATINILELTVQ
jgi:hypothetical protein